MIHNRSTANRRLAALILLEMAGESDYKWMKRVLPLLVLASMVLGACAGSQALGPNHAAIVEDGIEYYLETDKSSYTLSESVQIRYRIMNKTDEVKELGSVPNCEYCVQQFQITLKGKEVWRSCRVIPPCGTKTFRLNPHESWEYSDIAWNMVNDHGTLEPDDDFPIVPGVYTITGKLWSLADHSRVPVSVSIEIK